MDYEKAYKEALERARMWRDKSGMPADRQGILDDIFPQLKESEDEQIRKEIEQLIQCMHDADPRKERWIAWLEKQDDKDKLIKELGEYKVKYTQEVLEKHINSISNKDDERLRKTTIAFLKDFAEQGYENAIECIDWLEKQGEQKPVDNVGSKFKVEEGKWYVCTQTFVLRGKIVIIKGQTYQAEKDNVIKGENGCRFIDRHDGKASDYFRSWTIQDAKDGDVLVFKNNIGGIIICKSPSDYDTRSYCRLIRDNLINKEESGWDSTLLVPATKEQRDTLLKAMADARYEWDAEKKELKKISQRMVSAEAKEALYDKPTDEEMKELLRTEYEKGRADTPSEMKSSWSEEDEVKINRIVACLENLNVADNDILLKDVNWLKSLKERYTWKPSDEQMDALAWALSLAKNCGEENAFDLRTLYEQLKKLKGE